MSVYAQSMPRRIYKRLLMVVNSGAAGWLEKRSASLTFINYLFVQTDFYVHGGIPQWKHIQKEIK